MDTREKLYQVMELMKEAENLLNEIKEGNKSIRENHGYGIDIIIQELNRFGDNSKGYQGYNKNVQEIIDYEGESWENNN